MLSTLPVVNSDFFKFDGDTLRRPLQIVHRHCFLDVLKFALLGRKKWIVLTCRTCLLKFSFWFQRELVVPKSLIMEALYLGRVWLL